MRCPLPTAFYCLTNEQPQPSTSPRRTTVTIMRTMSAMGISASKTTKASILAS